MKQEYKWGFIGTSQGHFTSYLGECFFEAVLESQKKSNHTIKVEIFLPKREVIGFLKDGEFITPDGMNEIIESER